MKRKFYITPKELKKSYLALQSMLKVAQKYGVSKKLILNYMNKYGIERRDITCPYVDRIRELAGEGKTSQEIATSLGISSTYACRIAREHGFQIKDPFHKGYTIHQGKYILVWNPSHPSSDQKGYVRLHRLVATNVSGRSLSRKEVVHHIDGDPSNNNPTNLVIVSQSEHMRLHYGDVHKKHRKKKSPPCS